MDGAKSFGKIHPRSPRRVFIKLFVVLIILKFATFIYYNKLVQLLSYDLGVMTKVKMTEVLDRTTNG